MKSKYPNEQKLLFMLCQAPGGLTFTDISSIVKLWPNQFGNWRLFLQEMIINDDNDMMID